jgi:hypothetical protein
MHPPASRKKGPAVARVTFIRHQPVIEAEFRAGWSALAIYERHQDKLSTISYRQFLRYIAAWRSPPLARTAPTTQVARPEPAQRRSHTAPSVLDGSLEPPGEDASDEVSPKFTFRPSKPR